MKKLISGIIFTATMLFSVASMAVPVVEPWTISGPGTTSATTSGTGVWDLSYSLNPAGYNTVTWSATGGPVYADGDYDFNWDFSGFNAYYQVTAFLKTSQGTTLVNVGPANCCTTPSAGFDYSGAYTFTGVHAGDTIGFTMGGSNFDSNNQLNGTLHLEQTNVPAPAPFLVFGFALACLGLTRRLQKTA